MQISWTVLELMNFLQNQDGCWRPSWIIWLTYYMRVLTGCPNFQNFVVNLLPTCTDRFTLSVRVESENLVQIGWTALELMNFSRNEDGCWWPSWFLGLTCCLHVLTGLHNYLNWQWKFGANRLIGSRDNEFFTKSRWLLAAILVFGINLLPACTNRFT